MFIDPDWKPVGETLNKQDLDNSTNYFFTVKDRNGKTSRSLDWLVIHEEGESTEEQSIDWGNWNPPFLTPERLKASA